MDRVGTVLPKILKKRGLHKHAQAALLVQTAQQWLERMLPRLKRELRAQSYKDCILVIECQTSISAQECNAKKEELRQHLTATFAGCAITDIRLMRA